MSLPEFIPEELEAPQLDLLGRQLSNEVARLGKLVGGYESDYTAKTKAYKLEFAKAKVIYKDAKYNATMINAMAETSEAAQKAANELQQAEATLIIGKASLDGREAQYQMVKKLLDLKIQELRTFRG